LHLEWLNNPCGKFLPFVEYIFDGMVGYSSSDNTGGMTLMRLVQYNKCVEPPERI